jgi:DNA excision repair protein ERCC-6
VLAAQIVSFLNSVGGSAASDLLVAHFRALVSEREMPLFKQLLRQVATLQRQRSGVRVWMVKPEFREEGREWMEGG